MNIRIQTTTGSNPDFELITLREFDLVRACLVNRASPSHTVENIAEVIKHVREEEVDRMKAELAAAFKLEISDDEAKSFYDATEGPSAPIDCQDEDIDPVTGERYLD